MTYRQKKILYEIRSRLYESINGHQPDLTWHDVFDILKNLDSALNETKDKKEDQHDKSQNKEV